VRGSGEVTLTAAETGCTEQLARFFPKVQRVRIPVELTAPRAGGKNLHERVVLEFAGKEHTIFLTTLPIEFDDRVSLAAPLDGALANGSVVAVQYYEGCKAVAVRFSGGPCKWVGQS
jgi:hypothetical protein